MKGYIIEFNGSYYPLRVWAKNLHGARVIAGQYIAKSRHDLAIKTITEVE